MERDRIKLLIDLSTSFEDGDAILTEHAKLETDAEKIAYLRGMYNCAIIGRSESDLHTDYVALLTAIINQKWR